MSGIVTAGRKTFKDTAGANTYTIGADATRVTISGKMTSGDIINLEGLASEYTASASGRTITLKSATQTVTFQLSNTGGAASVRFLDGELTAGFASKGGATLGGVKLTKKPVDIDDSKLNEKLDSASVDFTGATGGGSTGGGSTGGSNSGSTLALTSSTNVFNGTSGDDYFDAALNATGAVTLNPSDVLDGGAGNDTLAATFNAAGTYQASSISNIEAINATFITAASTMSLTGATGYKSVNAVGSTVDSTFSGINSTAVELSVKNTTSDATFGFLSTALEGTNDQVNITVSGVNQGATDGIELTAGVETVQITSSGGTTNVVDEIESLTTDTITKLVVAGDTGLTITSALETTVRTVDASGMKGTTGLTATLGAVAAATVTGSSGNDSLTVSSVTGNVNVAGGAGNDTVTISTTLANTDSLDGGEGTDTLVTRYADASGYTLPSTVTIKNFESLRLTTDATGTLTLSNIDTGITKLVVASDSDDNSAGNFVFNAGTSTLEVGTSDTTIASFSNNGAATTLAVDAEGTAGTDQLTIKNANGLASVVDAFDTVAITSTDFETLIIDTGNLSTATAQSVGTIGVTGSAGFTTKETVKFVGANNITAGVITADIVDASGLTGSSGTLLTMTTGSLATTVTGSSGNDTLFADGTANVSVDGGDGRDAITGSSGNDTLLGGAGNDTITSGAGNDTVNGGAGNDTLTFGDNFGTSAADSVDGGDGTDILSITNASLTTLAALSLAEVVIQNGNIKNIESVYISDDLDQGTFDVARLGNVTNIRIGDWSGAETISGLAANSTVTLLADGTTNAANDLTVSLGSSSGSADVLNIALINDGAADFGEVSVASVETINISTAEATATSTSEDMEMQLTASGITTLNITGTEDLDIDAVAINATAINITATGWAKVLGGSAAQLINGGAGGDSLGGGGGNDTINGGAGADYIYGGTGNDSLTGGEGADTIESGAGNDTIVLTETTALGDDVVLAYSNYGGDGGLDAIVGFVTGTGGDQIVIDLSELESSSVTGIESTSATNFISTFTANTDAAAGDGGVEVLTGAETLGAGDNVLVIASATFSSTDDVETALESTGDFALAFATDTSFIVQHDAFLVVYSDGTDTYVASARVETDPGTNGVFAAGALEIENLAKITGLSSISSTTFVNGNFGYIA